jgi:hypothetical protein
MLGSNPLQSPGPGLRATTDLDSRPASLECWQLPRANDAAETIMTCKCRREGVKNL